MLGILPIQKPDAYIHFAPKEQMELKYCVSIELHRVSPSGLFHGLVLQQHSATGLALNLGPDAAASKLKISSVKLLALAAYNRGPFPLLASGRLFELSQKLPLIGWYNGPHLRSPMTEPYDWLLWLIAPFGTHSVQFPIKKEMDDLYDLTRCTWTYKEATALHGRSVYQLTAKRAASDFQDGAIVKFWFGIKDSALERCETTIRNSQVGVDDFRFVMTRIH